METVCSSAELLHASTLLSVPPTIKPRPQSVSSARRQTPQQLRQLATKRRPPSVPEDRWLAGYTKIKKLGAGGFGTVWQVIDAKTSAAFALKQIPKDDALMSSAVASAITEARVGTTLFAGVDVVGDKLRQRLPSSSAVLSTKRAPLECIAQLYRIKGDFYQGSRVYKILHRPLYLAMQENIQLLKTFLRQLISAVATLTELGVVHADIKPDNILVTSTLQPNGKRDLHLKLIDFGAAFRAASPRLSSATTPEYVPPDIHELLRTKHSANHIKLYFEDHCTPHAFDMWSVGSVFLEIAAGVPIWFAFKSRVDESAKPRLVTGLMSAPGRKPDKIALRQTYVAENLAKCLRDSPGMNVDSKRWQHGVDLLQRMLTVCPRQRISPQEALAHPFLSAL
ncbi:serine/threonine protein kinase [Saprolegnia parasitica CBS 223.65]|uniref:Serine/threonine protein kinase n=1 Tax=Saprolegnia parasitica (strain CBS 223.65) TaxID=695850 RepID=A0A067CME8_SAPPC|nr:serine/threonine protein kinase [Saprolegnia parasitica CBS 223.65]KDO31879.1 serine/threonine protein kinase [Saprolegnia parasitica CBS 223.65]|eukprot:XP_012197078.1 serine/threonine protein kinase [Saprolegnia parasitica CBS 223.65]